MKIRIPKILTPEEIIAQLKKELKELEEQIAAAEKATEDWPQINDEYFRITHNGHVYSDTWEDWQLDRDELAIGNVFRTQEEAEHVLHRLRARKKFLDAGGHEGIEGYGELQPNAKLVWKAYPVGISGEIRAFTKTGVSVFEIWFDTEEDCQEAIDSLTDEEKAALCWEG